MGVQCVRVKRRLEVNVLISALSLHVFKGWAVEGGGTWGSFYLTDTRIWMHRHTVKFCKYCLPLKRRCAFFTRGFRASAVLENIELKIHSLASFTAVSL